jgi:hypothetical protein
MPRQRARKPSARPAPVRWYLLIHQIPPEPLYLRAKIRQRLTRVGAVALKNSVYVLPFRDDCLEDFQWIAGETVTGGGEAHVCAAEFPGAAADRALRERFRRDRDADYAALAAELSDPARGAARGADPAESAALVARVRRRIDQIARLDFFAAEGRKAVEARLSELEETMRSPEPPANTAAPSRRRAGSIWTTRRGIKVDRIASAWLIRRFLDPKARFRFVDPAARAPKGEIRFDMVGGDFTHADGGCTFETLVSRHGLKDPALTPVAEIVHDIDLKDEKFGRPETPGVERVLAGLLGAHASDEDRLARGYELFDGLYESFRADRSSPA